MDTIENFSKSSDLLLCYLRSKFNGSLNYYVLYEGSDQEEPTSFHYYCTHISTFYKSNHYKLSHTKMRDEKRFIYAIIDYGANINAVTHLS
ncbi:hypothetical protein [Vaccinia virus]|nr:hypothetical protein [Vaccinia virus]